ncbi:MAG: glycosyltransferase [Nanoarchaeota archaeon]|nr:glycosyltransferase [Nanoarchaeota archaeon]
MKASIILATYKEKDNIGRLIKTILEACKKDKLDCEVIVVDDNSPDGTADVVNKEYGKDKRVRLIVRTNEKGLGTAVGKGVKESTGDVLVLMDSDFSHDPNDIPKMVRLTKEYEIVNGSRHMKGGYIKTTWFRKLATFLLRVYMSLVLQLNITDYTNGYIVIRKNVVNKLEIDKIFYGYGDYYFRLFYNAVYKTGAKIKEVPVYYKFREAGESKTNFVKHGWQYATSALKLRFGR